MLKKIISSILLAIFSLTSFGGGYADGTNDIANSNSDRYSFRIKFDKYVKNQTLLGLDELCLNNCYSDSTYMREYLHYEILEELGMNVPKMLYCNVYINGELFGFYLAVEAIDDSFLEREFGEDYESGNLYKMDMGSTLEYKEDENYTYADRKMGSDKELTVFKKFVKKLNSIKDGEKGDTESFLNVDSALKYIASNTVLCNYDSYNGNNHHNFYLYQGSDGVFTVIPWDFNMSFGGFNGTNATVGIDTPFISGSLESLPLIGKLLSIDEYKERYYGYIKEIMGYLENFDERVAELKEIIKPYVENDPTSFYSLEDFEKSTSVQTAADDGNKKAEEKPSANAADGSRSGGQPFGRQNRDGGQPFGGTSSIINCVSERLQNINEQFGGTASKTTTADTERRGGQTPENQKPPENNEINTPENDFRPPQNQNDNHRPQNDDDFQNRDFPPREEENRPDNNKDENDKQIKTTAVRVHVDGHIVSFDTNPIIKNDTTLVGVRGVLEALGATVDWNEETQTVTAVKDNTEIVLTVGSDKAYVNGKAYTLSEMPIIENNSTMIPIRFVSEQLGMKVTWNDETKLITVLS